MSEPGHARSLAVTLVPDFLSLPVRKEVYGVEDGGSLAVATCIFESLFHCQQAFHLYKTVDWCLFSVCKFLPRWLPQ